MVLSLLALANVPSAFVRADVPHVTSISPVSGSNVGGTRITLEGSGFEDSSELRCKFSRVNPDTEQVTEKQTSASFVNSHQVVCDSPQWDEATCPYCDKDVHGSTCNPSCANSPPSAESHANLMYSNGVAHFNALNPNTYGTGGGQGQFPCPSAANEYKENWNPNGQYPMGYKTDGHRTVFFGHSGSQFLRTDSKISRTEVGPGSFIKIESQFFTVLRIETCEAGDVACWCDGQWSKTQLITNQTTTPTAPITEYPIGPKADSHQNNDMYEYDNDKAYWDQVAPPTCTAFGAGASPSLYNQDGTAYSFPNSGNWLAGTKITLDEKVYKIGGTPNQAFFTNDVYVSSKKPCVDCKCSGGCKLTVTVTNNGRTYSGAGTNGNVWTGSGQSFSAKHVIPEVTQVQFSGLEGHRDSSRLFVPLTGGSKLVVKGKNFQNSPLLRVYFDTPRIMVQAEFVDEETLLVDAPSFLSRQQDHTLNTDASVDNVCSQLTQTSFAIDISGAVATTGRLYDTHCTDSQTNGAAVLRQTTGATTAISPYSYSHVQVTNNGMHRDLSPVQHRRADGSLSYLEGEGSPHRSTCYQLAYPSTLEDAAVQPHHEQQWPCHDAHQSGQVQGNDVQIKYSPCYEALSAEVATGSDYKLLPTVGSEVINTTHSLGQKFRIPRDAAGPLVAVDLHLIKSKADSSVGPCTDTDDCEVASRRPTTLEVCVSAGGFKSQGQTLGCEWISIQNIVNTSTNYIVYFAKPAYLLGYYDNTEPGYSNMPAFTGEYYLTITHVSGPATVSWATNTQSSGPALTGDNGYHFDATTNTSSALGSNLGFSAAFYTCDACRWKYKSQQTAVTTYQVGKITGRQNQSDTYLKTHPGVTCKSTASQSMGRSFVNEGFLTAEGLPRVNTGEDPTGIYADECGTPSYREQMAQAIRPLEDMTLITMRTKLASAFSAGGYADSTETGDFESAQGSKVSVWITEHGKMGESVCQTFTGGTQTSDVGWKDEYNGNGAATNAQAFGAASSGSDVLSGCGPNNKDCMHCDSNGDGVYGELCFIGARCNRTLPEVWGGCGVHGVCAMAKVLTNAHELRNHPEGNGPVTSRCGEDQDCKHSQQLKVQHSIQLPQATQAPSSSHYTSVIWEFEKPVVLSKHTTYYVNMAVDESISDSDSVYWLAGTTGTTPQGPNRTPFLASYQRTNIVVDGQAMFTWLKNPNNHKFDLELNRCVTALPSITSFKTAGSPSGECAGRSSPRGGFDGATITVTGKNFFPSNNLGLMFLKPDGQMGPRVSCVSTKYDFSEMECPAPSWNPYADYDCSVPHLCNGVAVMPTNDGINFGPELFNPKFVEPYEPCTANRSPSGGCDAVPVSMNGTHHVNDIFVQQLGLNTLKYCLEDIFISPSGNDYSGDGSRSRPFATIQRAIDSANPRDVIVMMPGTYTGTGNRGIRHMGKAITIVTEESDPSIHGSCWCGLGNDYTCMLQQGSTWIPNPACVGETKRYTAGTGISNRDNTVIDCQFSNEGFVINNNKDSMSPSAGFVDFDGITVRNCEQLKAYN